MLVHRGSIIAFSANVVVNSKFLSNAILCHHPSAFITLTPEARIIVEDDTGISASIFSSRTSIHVGKRVLIGAGCLVTDSDHHPTDISDVSARRYAEPRSQDSSPVIIEDDAFIGARVTILKGVTIGRGAVIAAGSVVSRSIPAGAVAGGNPCRVISGGALNGSSK